MRLHTRISFATSLLFLGTLSFANSKPEVDLMTFFGSTCASQGNWTRAAMEKAVELQTVLEDIKKDPDCEGMAAESGTAGAIATALANLSKQNSDNSDQIALLNSEGAIMSSIAYTQDPTTIKSLQSLLSRIDSKITTSNTFANLSTQASAANSLLTSTRDLVQQAINNKDCLLKRPGFLESLGALVANVGAAVTAVNPALGLGMATGGTLLSDLIKLGKDSKLVRAMHRLDDSAIKPEAFSCVLESLSDDYCRGNDAITAIDWNETHQDRSLYPASSPLYGMGLMKREIPILVDWLSHLRGANDAQNKYDAQRNADFRTKQALYLSSPAIASGVINESTDSINAAAGNADNQWPVIRKMVDNLVSQLYGSDPYGNTTNPLFGQFSKDEAKFWLVGFDTFPANTTGNGLFDSYQMVKDHMFIPGVLTDTSKMQGRFTDWFNKVKPSMDADFSNTLQPDVQAALESAFKPSQNFGTKIGSDSNDLVSPYQSLASTITYLQFLVAKTQSQNHSTSDLSTDLIHYLPDTISILNQMKNDLDIIHQKSVVTSKTYKDTLNDIYLIAGLENGGIFIQNRLNDHVNNALVRYLSDPTQTSDTAPILSQTLASARMTDLLVANDPLGGTAPVRADISGANEVVVSTFKVFVDTFQKEIGRTLELLKEQEATYLNNEKKSAEFKATRSKICLMLTEMPYWPNRISFSNYCEGTTVTNTVKGPASKALTKDYTNGSHSCTYYQLKRDTLIYETRMKMDSSN